MKGPCVTAGYYRRQFYNIAVVRNFAVNPNTDYTAFTVTAPSHPNLPGGGGERITLYNLNPAKQGADNSITINSPDMVQASMSGLAKRNRFTNSAPANPAIAAESAKAASL